MTKDEYAELRKDPGWQKKRLKIMEYAQWRCQWCGKKDKTLQGGQNSYELA